MSHKQETETPLTDEVRRGYARGWSYTPLRNGKVPILKNWQTRQRASLDECLSWARIDNVGVRTGEASGVAVIDTDPDAPQEFISQLPTTALALTGREGGAHHYYLPPPADAGIKNWNGKVSSHVDVKVDGGQVVSVGSRHQKTGKVYRWADGMSPEEITPAPFPVKLIKSFLSAQISQSSPVPSLPPPQASKRGANGATPAARCMAYLDKCPDAISGEHGHDSTLRAACECFRFGLSQSEAAGVMRWFNQRKTGSEQWTDKELEHKLVDAEAKVRSEGKFGARISERDFSGNGANGNHGAGKSDNSAGNYTGGNYKPKSSESVPLSDYVLIPGSHTSDSGVYVEIENAHFADEVLSRMPEGMLYRRGGVVGQIVGDAGTRKFEEIGVERIRRLVKEPHARLGAWRSGKDKTCVLDFKTCSRDLGGLILDAARVHPAVRELKLLTPYPVFTAPNYELCREGWNEEGIFYDEPESLRGICPETDSIRETLSDLLIDFPFKGGPGAADWCNFVGLLLTPLIRPALEGSNTPMHLLLAPLERTGKSKLAEQVFGRVVLGRSTPAMQLTGSLDEQDKRVLSLLLTGDTAAHLDNLGDFIDSAVLASLLTASVYQGRQLGGHRLLQLPNNLTLVASGNNVKATGEIAKRIIPINLQPLTDTPEARTDFRHPDLEAYVTEARRRVLAALLGMVARWNGCGSPAGRVMLGGFEKWSRAIGGIMGSNGFDRWLANLRDWVRTADPAKADLVALVNEWHTLRQKSDKWTTVKASQLMGIAKSLQLFPSCFQSSSEAGQVVSFTRRVLSPAVNAPVDKFRIERIGAGNNSIYSLAVIECVPETKETPGTPGNIGTLQGVKGVMGVLTVGSQRE